MRPPIHPNFSPFFFFFFSFFLRAEESYDATRASFDIHSTA
jgi:hypothetical protein